MGVNYFKVAELLGPGWTTLDAQQAHEQLEDGFMTPHDAELAESEAWEGSTAGTYYRLSASGYLDCTDWHGPFDTVEQGLAHLIQLYAEV